MEKMSRCVAVYYRFLVWLGRLMRRGGGKGVFQL